MGDEPANPLLKQIQSEIALNGPISVARFMELALYQPDHGYYSARERKVGRSGDFFTSVSVGSLFGKMLGYQFAQWLRSLDAHHPLQIVEAGAHNGDLALDLLNYFHEFKPELFKRLEYIVIEPLAHRIEQQRDRLEGFRQKVRWVTSVDDLHNDSINGLFISNELLDAMPVHQFRWDAKQRHWVEWGVGSASHGLEWLPLSSISDPSAEQLHPLLPAELQELFPNGFTIEVSSAACHWWSKAATKLNRGCLFTVDYGIEELEFLQPHRSQGTLRAYLHHKTLPNILEEPGQRDITAHVNFTHLRKSGTEARLKEILYQPQSFFLSTILRKMLEAKDQSIHWDTETVKHFQTLTHPEHLGRSFKVFAQGRNLSEAQ